MPRGLGDKPVLKVTLKPIAVSAVANTCLRFDYNSISAAVPPPYGRFLVWWIFTGPFPLVVQPQLDLTGSFGSVPPTWIYT